MNIQAATNSARSIDDFMRAMYKKSGLTGMEYTVQDIAAVASQTAGADQTEFFERYVKQGQLSDRRVGYARDS